MSRSRIRVSAVDPDLIALLRGAALCGLAVVACLPAARGSNALLGWWPLWLVAMPVAAWLLLALRARQDIALSVKRRRRVVAGGPRQARRLRRDGRHSVQAAR